MSDAIREEINRLLDERTSAGVETYGIALSDETDDAHDWRDMLIEELLDGLQYAAKEIIRLRRAA